MGQQGDAPAGPMPGSTLVTVSSSAAGVVNGQLFMLPVEVFLQVCRFTRIISSPVPRVDP